MSSPRLTGSHSAHFWQSDEFATEHLAAFVREAVEQREDVLVMATPQRCEAVRTALRGAGLSVEDAETSGAVTFSDADEVIEAIVVDAEIDRVRLAERLLPFVQRSARPKRIYGEMVSLLTSRGLLETALTLERAGHELAQDLGVQVLCGYHLPAFDGLEADAIARAIHTHQAAQLEVPGAADHSGATAITVLLADDYEDTRDLFGEYLRFRGYRVALACDGVEAIERARALRPDVILLDIRMPRLTGIEVMRQLKADASFTYIPIVALTAHALDDERAEMLGAGFDAVITKPCLPDALADMVASLASARRRPS